jgi:glycosyltransferase involved in cell wall biosynthesis
MDVQSQHRDSEEALPAIPRPVLVSICIPAYNEEQAVARTVREAADVLRQLPGAHELLVLDDGSTDATHRVLCDLAGQCRELRVLRHARNLGCATSLHDLAQAAEGRYIFETGADGQWRMSELPQMLTVIESGYDLVIGVRRVKRYGPWRRLVSAAFNLLVRLLWGRDFGDLGSIRLARADLWKRIPLGRRSAFGLAEKVLIAHCNGARIATILVDHLPRATGRSRFANPWQALYGLFDLLAFRLSARSRLRLNARAHRPPATAPPAAAGTPAGPAAVSEGDHTDGPCPLVAAAGARAAGLHSEPLR